VCNTCLHISLAIGWVISPKTLLMNSINFRGRGLPCATLRRIPFSSGSAHMGNHAASPFKPSEEAEMDRYTKMILTTIAISLVVIAFKDVPIISNALASSVVEVRVVDMNWTRYSPLPVRVEGKIKCE